MLRTRLLVGSLLALAMGGVLFADGYFAPHYPFLLVCVLAVGFLASRELGRLLPVPPRPDLACAGTVAVLLANWFHTDAPTQWLPVFGVFLAVVLSAFLIEMIRYTGPGDSTARVAGAVFVVAYLGLLPSCLVRLRWLPDLPTGLALAAAIFIPKVCDTGAYSAGRILGRHPMTPRLSPKKTWEGFAGGMLAAAGLAVGISFLGDRPLFRHGVPEAVAFGLAVGLAGVLGDLAESMMKRDGLAKDASRNVPGFGGVLDVIDSVLFAAPVAYLWFAR